MPQSSLAFLRLPITVLTHILNGWILGLVLNVNIAALSVFKLRIQRILKAEVRALSLLLMPRAVGDGDGDRDGEGDGDGDGGLRIE
jgi:hypothetical protein